MSNTASIVMVGLCNNDPMIQLDLGTFGIDWKLNLPVLCKIVNSNREVNKVDVYHGAAHGDAYTFNTWCGGHGLSIRKDKEGEWRFSTGLHGYSSGSSGKLCNGGPEMELLYNQWLSNVA